MAKITYEDKVALIENPDIPDINKVKSTDMNEIKSVVNENDDKFLTNGLNISNEVDEDYDVNFIKGNNIYNQIVVDNEKYTDTLNVGQFDSRSRVNFLKSNNLFDKTDITNNYRLTSDGSLYADTGYFASGFIKVKPNTTYKTNIEIASTKRMCEYNSSKTFITGKDNANTNQITTSSTTQYIRIVGLLTELDTIMLVEGTSMPTTYEPYITPSIYVDNEEIYSKPVVLWQNSSPTSAFAGQEITLNEDISNYKYYEVIVVYLNSQNHLFNTGRIPTTNTTIINCCSTINYRRFITSVSGNKITFGNGQKVSTYGTGTDDNTYLIPYQILGYEKKSTSSSQNRSLSQNFNDGEIVSGQEE